MFNELCGSGKRAFARDDDADAVVEFDGQVASRQVSERRPQNSQFTGNPEGTASPIKIDSHTFTVNSLNSFKKRLYKRQTPQSCKKNAPSLFSLAALSFARN